MLNRCSTMLWPLLCLYLAFLTACQLAPTRVETREARGVQVREDVEAPIQITPQTVVLDARPAFEYSLAHIPGSLSVQWDEFQQPEATSRGVLQLDRFAIARRLARLGIRPDTPVLVVGKGLQGTGEEGRLAWMLNYLGVQNVRVTSLEALGTNLTNQATPPPKNAPVWKPETVEPLLVTRTEIMDVINRNQTSPRPGQRRADYAIIDVRTGREYLNKEGLGLRTPIPNMGGINIEWSEFFTRNGRPDPDIVARLQQVGIERDQRVILVSEQGLRSGAVTFALRRLGFERAGNYAGGLQDLVAGDTRRN